MFAKVRLWWHKLNGKSVANDPFPPFLPLGGSENTGKPASSRNDLPPRPECQSISYQPAIHECDDDKRAGLHRSLGPPSSYPSPPPTTDQHGTKAAQAAPRKSPVSPPPEKNNFFTEYGESNRYSILEIIGKGSYGIVCSAVDNYTGEKVAIKKITNVFEHVSDATRILREVKLLRLLKHPDIVKIQHIMLPPNARDYKDIYVVFELMETDLHQVIKANDDLTPEHHQFFLYQMLRGLKYLHSAKVFHRDLKPKNILANADCKLKICDFGLARPAFDNGSTMIFWTDYVATRWYRAPELCGSFFAKYSPSIDIWGVGCIFAEVLLGRPLFPGKNVVNQLEIITDLLGTPSDEVVAKVRNEKARRFLLNLPKKRGVPFSQVFPGVDSKALQLLRALLSFDPSERPTAEQALQHPYFQGLHNPAREPTTIPVSKLAFEFDRRKLTTEEVRELIYLEILEYHPAALAVHLSGNPKRNFSQPNALDNFKRMWIHLENNPGAVLPPGYQHKGRQAVGSSVAPRLPGPPTGCQGSEGAGGQAQGSQGVALPAAGAGAADAAGVGRPDARSSGKGGERAAVAPEQQGGGASGGQVMQGDARPGAYAEPRRTEERRAEACWGVQGGRDAETSAGEAGRSASIPDPGARHPQRSSYRMPNASSSSGSSYDGGGSSAFSAGAGGRASDRGAALSLSPQQLHVAAEGNDTGPSGGHLTAPTGRHSLQLSRADEMVHACAPTCIPAPTLGVGVSQSMYPRADAWMLGRHSLPGPVWGEQEARSLSSTFSSQPAEVESGGKRIHALAGEAEEKTAGAAWGGASRKEQPKVEGFGRAVGDSLLRRKKEVGVDAGNARP